MIKKLLFISLVFFIGKNFSQEINLDKYQYIIVPEKFDFLKENDQYQTSSLTKFLLKKKGFKVLLSNEEIPKEIRENRCKSLEAVVKDESSMLSIKTVIQLKDCYGKTVYSSKVGRSKFKEYKRGFQDAIRKAYESMEDLNYGYNPNKTEVVKEVKEVKKEAPLVNEEIVKPKKEIKVEKKIKKIDTKDIKQELPVLYAQPKDDGFQLINTKPEVVFVILKTSKSDFYIIKNKSGTLYKNDDVWVAEYYENGTLKKEKYQIKF